MSGIHAARVDAIAQLEVSVELATIIIIMTIMVMNVCELDHASTSAALQKWPAELTPIVFSQRQGTSTAVPMKKVTPWQVFNRVQISFPVPGDFYLSKRQCLKQHCQADDTDE